MSQTTRRVGQKYKRNKHSSLFPLFGGIALIGVIVLLAVLFVRGRPASKLPAAIEVHGAPSLKVDREQVDLGNVKLGQLVQVSFSLTNVGDQPLRFSEQPYIEVVEGC